MLAVARHEQIFPQHAQYFPTSPLKFPSYPFLRGLSSARQPWRSHLYLRVHYLSDVLAPGAESLVWLVLCHMAMETLRRTRARAVHG